MLFFNFKFIFSHLVRTCGGAELKKTLEFLEVIAKAILGLGLLKILGKMKLEFFAANEDKLKVASTNNSGVFSLHS